MNPKISKKAILIIALVAVIFIGLGLYFIFRPTVPNSQQIRSDFLEEQTDLQEYSITDFSIEPEENSRDDTYNAVVTVTYNDQQAEYTEKHHVTYEKQDEWILQKIKKHQKETWTTKPLALPKAEEIKTNCLGHLETAGQFTGYQQFENVPEKTKENLAEGTGSFIFKVSFQTPMQTISGEIEFSLEFNDKTAQWKVKSYSYCDTYQLEQPILQTWSGKGKNSGSQYTIKEKEFTLTIASVNSQTMSGSITYDGKTYSLSGEYTLYNHAVEKYHIDMQNEQEKVRVQGTLSLDGTMDITVDTAYHPNTLVYFTTDRYNATLSLNP